MLAWSEGTDNGRQKTRNHGYDVIVGELLLITPISSQTCHAKPKTQINRRRTLPASFRWWDAYRRSSLAWKTSLRKVRTLWHCSRLRSVALLPMIDRGDIRQAIDRCSNITKRLHCRALVMVSSSIRLTAWLQKFKAGGTVREIDVWAESPRLSRSGYLHHRLPCHGLLIITVITPLPTTQRDKNARELKLANAAITDMQMRQRDVAALDAKYTKELADADWKWFSAWWCCRWSSSVCTSKQSVSQCVKPPPPPAWIMQPPPDWQTPLNGIISPSEGWSLCKNNWKEPRSILMSSADRVAHIDGQLMQMCEQYTRTSSGV